MYDRLATPTRTRLEGEFDYAAMLAGESCGVVNDIKPAGIIVRDLAREAEATLA